jgi:hypothetical protein
MLAVAFLNPLLLVGLPLCAIPVVIHLLNRRRFRQVPWAAMEYLLAAMKRNRKRLRMEQWLVLLLRTLAVLLLVFLVSRPQLGGGSLLGAKTHHVILLDDSASMSQRSGSTALFERAQDRVRQLADDLAQRRSGDLLSIVRASRPAQPDLWSQRIGPDIGRRVGALLKEWTVGDGAPDLGRALRANVERAATVAEASRTRHYVVGDRRASDWVGEDDRPRPSVLEALAAMGAEDHLDVLAVGGQPQNVAVVGVRLLDRLAIAGVPTALALDVQNFGLDPTLPSTVAVEVDGQSRVVQPVPSLLPGERVAIPIAHTFHQAGFHRVEAQLETTEQYVLDDRRTLAIDVRDKSRVLLVDGQPDEEQGEVYFLSAAMEMPESGIEPHILTDVALEDTPLDPYDAVWLCNVQAPTAATAERLEQFVAAGGGLVIMVGAQVDAERYNQMFWRDGKGLLPLPLGEIDGDPDRPEGAVLVAKEHGVCDRVGEVLELLVANVVLVKRWLTIVDDGAHEASIVMRIRDAEGPPLLVTKTFGVQGREQGGGEVALFAVTADRFWSNLPSTDVFVVLANQLHRFGARRRDLSGQNLLPEGVYRLQLDPGTYRADVALRGPSGDERTFTAAETSPQLLTLEIAMADLPQLGAYEVELLRHDGVPERRMFARNPPTAESRLVGFPAASFARLYPPELQDRVTFVRDETPASGADGEGELWHLLAMALLAGLLLESLLAWRFGRR